MVRRHLASAPLAPHFSVLQAEASSMSRRPASSMSRRPALSIANTMTSHRHCIALYRITSQRIILHRVVLCITLHPVMILITLGHMRDMRFLLMPTLWFQNNKAGLHNTQQSLMPSLVLAASRFNTTTIA